MCPCVPECSTRRSSELRMSAAFCGCNIVVPRTFLVAAAARTSSSWVKFARRTYVGSSSNSSSSSSSSSRSSRSSRSRVEYCTANAHGGFSFTTCQPHLVHCLCVQTVFLIVVSGPCNNSANTRGVIAILIKYKYNTNTKYTCDINDPQATHAERKQLTCANHTIHHR